jgi:calcium/calmodulin-dependent protein kinase I
LKISDFGLARQIISEEDQLKMTALGTPLYVSPEIYGGLGYGFATDLWGIGAILFEYDISLACRQ